MMRKISIALVIIALALFMIAGGIRVYRNWASVQYFGKIVEIKNGDFLIRSDEDDERLILTNRNTIIRRGRQPVMEELKVGSYVIVVGNPAPGGSVEAEVVRILDIPPL